MKKFIGYAVLALLVGGMVFLLFSNKKKTQGQASAVMEANVVSVETEKVTSESYAVEFTANGQVAPAKELKFVSDVSGQVIEIYVDKGSRVSKGTKLLKIDSELLQSDYEASRASYESLQKNVERFTNSLDAGGVSQQQLESLQTQLAAAKSRLDVSRRRLSDATVKSPMNGVINMRYVETGSLIAPNAPLFDIVDESSLKISCNLPESRIGKIAEGQKVTVTSSSLPGEKFNGRVSFIGIMTDRGLNYPVDIVLDRNDNLRIGMYMKVNFASDQVTKGILVPRDAITGGVKSSIVYLMKDGKAVSREVTLGEMNGDRVEILSGLEDGDEIIVSGLMNLTDGVAVKSIN